MISFKSLKLGLKICITILVFYFFLLEVLSISNFEVIEKELKSVNQRFLTLFLILSLTNALLFAVRTQLILNHYNYYPSLLSVYFVTMTRNFFSDLLPAKLGTLVYIYLLPRFLGTNYKLATSAFFHLTFLDIFAVGVLVLVLGGFASLTSKLNLTIYVYLAAVALLLTSILLIRVLPKFLKFALDKYSFRAHPNLQETLNLFENLNSSGIFTKLIGLALAQRFVKYFSYWILFLALVDIYGISSDSNPFFKAAFAFITAETFVSMPIFTIGGIGAFQTGWLLGFSILGLDREIAVSTSISHHVLTQAWGVIQGVFGVLLLLTLSGFFNKIKILTKAPFYPVQILALLIVSSFWILVSESRGGMAVNIKNSLTEICNHCVLYFDGKIKNNTTGIYSLTNGQIKEVYDTKEWFEQFPYFDQRGDRLLFSQTKSLSRFAKGRILELKNGQVNVLIENGLFPSLTRDGSIVFERDRKEVILFKDGKETKIFPLNEDLKKNIELSKPRISPSGKLLAITVNKPAKWHIWVVDLTSNKVIANFRGCEPWFWTDEKIVYIRILDGKRNINIFDLNKRKETSLITPFENYVTFYFPHAVDSLLFFGASEDKNAGAERGVFDLFVYDQNQKKLLKLVESTTLIKWPFLQTVSVNY